MTKNDIMAMTDNELSELRKVAAEKMNIQKNDKYYWSQVLSMAMTEQAGRAMAKAFRNL